MVLAVSVFLGLISWSVFGQTLGHQFINFDDDDYVFRNPKVSKGFSVEGVVWAFTNVHAANWHPLTWLSHMLDCQLYGFNPGYHHLTNVLLHTATSILLFLVLRRMTAFLWRSAFVAAVFVIHPLRAESVAWVAERKDLLSGLFFVLTLAAYVRFARGSWSTARYGLVLFLFALGLMCKPMLVTLPLVLLLLDYWPLNRLAPASNEAKSLPLSRLILEKLPLLALSAGSAGATLFAQKTAMEPLADTSLIMKLGNAIISSVAYMRQMLWPSDLIAYYPFSVSEITLARVLGSGVVLVSISVAVFFLRRYRYLVTGWLWYLIMLGPVIGILQVGNQARADRYTYLTQIGLALAITWAVADLCARWPHRRLFIGSLSAIILTTLILTARTQVSFWKDSQTLWSQVLSRSPNNVMAELNLGEAVLMLGRTTEAITHFERALHNAPRLATAHGSLGAALLKIGQVEAALSHFQQSLESKPNQASVHSSMAVALLEIGRVDESMTHLRKALEIDPNDGDTHYNLGNTFLQMGRARESLAAYNQAIKINPADAHALNNMAWILATWPDALIRDGNKAVALAERADSLTQGESPVIGATLAAAYAESGRFDDAVKRAQRALQLAIAQGDRAGADSIRAQLEFYQSGSAFRDRRPRH